jgi:PAS domain S-box-containing protein
MANKSMKKVSQKVTRLRESKAEKQAKSLHEQRVHKRTAELEVTNEEPKKEIIKLKQKEKKLQKSNQRLYGVLDSISDGLFSLDNKLIVTYFNKSAEQMLNRKSGDVLGRNIFKAFPEAKGSIFEEKYKQAIKEKIPISFETYFGIKPYENWYDVRVYPHKDGISVYFRVITERKRVEEEVKRFASFPQLNPNPILEVDSSGTIVFCNVAAIRILRKLSLRDTTLFLPNDVADILNALEQEKEVQFYREVKIKDRIFGEVLFSHHNLILSVFMPMTSLNAGGQRKL